MALFKRTNTRYVDRDGKRCRKVTAGARKRMTRSRDWYGEYRDADGIKRRVRLVANKSAAQQMLNELIRNAERGRAGLVDPFADHAKHPLHEHVADYRTHLESKGNTASHVNLTVSRVESIIEGCGFKRIGDVSASSVSGWLADQRALDGTKDEDDKTIRFGIASSNHYLTAMKAFTRWLVKDRRTADDRLAHLARLKADTDRRIERRHLSPADFGKFIKATGESGKRYGLSGKSRVMLYLTAAYTGLRASELASLTPASFHLGADPPTVTVEAAYSKHRKRDELPLHPELVSRLREWLTETQESTDDAPAVISIESHPDDSDGPMWPGRWAMDRRGWRMVKADLTAADIPYRDEQGRQFDFHALRHQFISMLAAAGVHPKTAQELARHSTITLTMDHYTHLRVNDLTSALNTLPSLTPFQEAQAATGTDDARVDVTPPHMVTRMVTSPTDISCDSVTSGETNSTEDSGTDGAAATNEQPLRLQGNEVDCVSLRRDKEASQARVSNGIRTRDLRNHNPAL